MSISVALSGCGTPPRETDRRFANYVLNYDTARDPRLQPALEAIDMKLRTQLGMAPEQTSVGLLDLKQLRLALIHPDEIEYAASIPKIGILLAYFELNPSAVTNLDPTVRHELGLMIKISSNEMAAKYSQQLGLGRIQQVLDKYHFYDAAHGGGIWVGKHYGLDIERIGDPIGNNSHAATVRQLLRFYLLMEQGKLVSAEGSKRMLEIFESPDIPHDPIKFIKGLAGRPELRIIRKSGTWEDWLHDTAEVAGPHRRYILVALTKHPKGDEYLEGLAREVDDLMATLR